MPELLADDPIQPWLGRRPAEVAAANVYQPVMFTAQDPLAVLSHPWSGRVALSADRAYRDAVVATAPELRRHGYWLYAWCDCRSDGTLPGEAVQLVKLLKLDGWIGQAESEDECWNAIDAGATEIVGNASALEQGTQLEIIRRDITFHQECYWGDSSPAPSQTDAQGIPAKLVVGLYPPCHKAAEYAADLPALVGPGGALGGIYYAEGGDDWTVFRV